MATAVARKRRGEIVRALGVSPDWIERLYDRGILHLDPDDRCSAGSGDPRLFGPRSTRLLALVDALMRAGLPPRSAARAAATFMDGNTPGRVSGSLYPSERTILISDQQGGARVVQTGADAPLGEVLHNEAAVVVDVSTVFARVDRALGLAPPTAPSEMGLSTNPRAA
jgi:hypothetical protein